MLGVWSRADKISPVEPWPPARLRRVKAGSPRAFVIGHPVAHSRSPLLHGFWLRSYGLRGSYETIDVAPGALPAFVAGLKKAGFVGGNVTVPHKAAIMALVEAVDPDAKVIGAVNTLWIEGGRLWGGNTDWLGFLHALDQDAPGWDKPVRHAVVLGAGGAARAVVHGLQGRGCRVTVVNRTAAAAAALAASYPGAVAPSSWSALPALLQDADLLVNTTALGMTGQPPLSLDVSPLPAGAIVMDIVYVPLETSLLAAARARGLRTVDGLGMLLHQAAPGFTRWFGWTPAVTPALRATLEADLNGG